MTQVPVGKRLSPEWRWYANIGVTFYRNCICGDLSVIVQRPCRKVGQIGLRRPDSLSGRGGRPVVDWITTKIPSTAEGLPRGIAIAPPGRAQPRRRLLGMLGRRPSPGRAGRV